MSMIHDLAYDARHALRSMRREPAMLAGIITTLALAIGANASIFSLVTQLMLAAPEGVAEPARVVHVNRLVTTEDGEQYPASTTSYPAFVALRADSRAFAKVAATHAATMTVGKGAELAEISSIQATGDYFAALGARPEHGRFFTGADDELPVGNPVVVLSYAYWKLRFDGEAQALGRELVLDGTPYTIIGVARPGFNGDYTAKVDVFVPLSAAMRNADAAWATNARLNLVSVVARLNSGVSEKTAATAATLTANAAREAAGVEDDRAIQTIAVENLLPGKSARQTSSARISLWLSAVSVIVLIIATANVGTLLLLRALRRRRETAIRFALGVKRSRLARLLAFESVVLALVGACGGLLVSRWMSDGARALLLPNIAQSAHWVDSRTLLSTTVIVFVVALLAGLAPLTQLFRTHTNTDLRSSGASFSRQQVLLQRALVGTQVALCTVLLMGAGLFVRSLDRVQSQDLGFSTARLLYVTIDFRTALTSQQKDALYANAARQLTGVTGVTGASITQASPFGPHHVPPISIPGMADVPTAGGQPPMMYASTPKYLALMGVTLTQGRLLTESDARTSPLVVLVNQTMANSVWPGENAIGKCIRVGFPEHMDGPPSILAPTSLPCRQVVGVVKDSRARSLKPDGYEARLMQYYLPFPQLPPFPFGDATEVSGLIVQTNRKPDAMVSQVQRAIQSGAQYPVLARVRPYQDLLNPQLRPWRLGASLFSAFAALALCIATVGMYAVIAYLAAQRTKEIGVRLALGATNSSMQRLIVRSALQMVGIGVAVGLAIAFIGAPLLQKLLFDTQARNVPIAMAAGTALMVAALAAAVVPALRASHVTPLEALRAD